MPRSEEEEEEDGEEDDELVRFDASAFDVSVNYSSSPEKLPVKPVGDDFDDDDFLLDSEQAALGTLEPAPETQDPAAAPSYWWIVLCIVPLACVAYLLQHQPPCSSSCRGVWKAAVSREQFLEDNARCFDTLGLLDAELAVAFALRQFPRRFSRVLNLPSGNSSGVGLLASIMATHCDLRVITVGSAPLALLRTPLPSSPVCAWQSLSSQPEHNNTVHSVASLSCLPPPPLLHQLAIVHNASQPVDELIAWLDPVQFCVVFLWAVPDRPTIDRLTKLASRRISIRQPADGVVMVVTE